MPSIFLICFFSVVPGMGFFILGKPRLGFKIIVLFIGLSFFPAGVMLICNLFHLAIKYTVLMFWFYIFVLCLWMWQIFYVQNHAKKLSKDGTIKLPDSIEGRKAYNQINRLTRFYALVLIPACFLSLLSGMAFDGGINLYTASTFVYWFSFPIIISGSVAGAWSFYRHQRFVAARLVGLLAVFIYFLPLLIFMAMNVSR